MTSKQQLLQDDYIDIRKYLHAILALWYWFPIVLAITFSIAFYINKSTVPVYSVSASMLLKDQTNSVQSGVENILYDMGFRNRSYKRYVENEIPIITSYDVIRQALQTLAWDVSYYSVGHFKTLELYRRSPFRVVYDTSFAQKKQTPVFIEIINSREYLMKIGDMEARPRKMKFNEWFSDESFSFSVALAVPSVEEIKNIQYYFEFNDIDELTTLYKSAVKVAARDKNSLVIDLSINGNVPEKQTDFLNALMETYIAVTLEEKNYAVLNTAAFIEEQLNIVRDSLEASERKLMQFRLNNKVVNLELESKNLYETFQQIENSKTEYVLQKSYLEYLCSALAREDSDVNLIIPAVIGITDQVLNENTKLLSSLLVEISRLEKNTYPSYPLLRQKKQQAEQTRKILLDNARNALDVVNIKLKQLRNWEEENVRTARTLPVIEREYITLKRSYALNDNIYNFLLQKKAETGILRASNSPDARIIDRARTGMAELTSPKKNFNYLMALLIGLLLPIAFVVVRDVFDDRIQTRSDVESRTAIPFAGLITYVKTPQTYIPAYDRPRSSAAESFRLLRSNLQYFLLKPSQKTVLFTSAISGEGKTFCAVNLAAIVAFSGKKTLIMGMDLRKPRLHTLFDLSNEKGLSTYLINESPMEEIICKTRIPNLDCIVSGPLPPNPAELIESRQMDELLTRLKENYDMIIIDTSPVAIVSDALTIVQKIDMVLFVVRQNFSTRKVCELINDLKEQKGIDNMALVLNAIDPKGPYGYSYQYNYGYGYTYGYSYGQGYYIDENGNHGNFIKNLYHRIRNRK